MQAPLRFIAVAVAFVAGGLSVWLAMRQPPAPVPGARDAGGVSLFPVTDAAAGPRIVIDPDSIQLLPDASLRLELPSGFDGGRD
ncbi:Hypothetical protein A7982_07671 [Minicystis rosea]|nr:Hypothetical protein A7982_07671 [Minicystis rosea]